MNLIFSLSVIISILPFPILALLYKLIPSQIPLFADLAGNPTIMAPKSILSVFRLPIMGLMEMAISLKAVKWAWLYTLVFLLIWTIYDYIKIGNFNSLAFILLISQNLIRMSIEKYLKWKMGKDEE
jgi:hypothetical protein